MHQLTKLIGSIQLLLIQKTKPKTIWYRFLEGQNYSFKDKYLLTATLRADGSSRFHKDNRWGLYPSTALGWRIIEEPFMKDLNTVSNLKLRLGYGITGQQEFNNGGLSIYGYISVKRFPDPIQTCAISIIL